MFTSSRILTCALRMPSRGRKALPAERAAGPRCSGDKEVADWVRENLQRRVVKVAKLSSGSWASSSELLLDDGSKLFAKMSTSRDPDSMFAGEAEGLNAMHATKTIRVPKVVHCGPLGERGSFILMEFLSFGGSCNQAELGEQLALMHLAEPAVQEAKEGLFGFPRDNTIGGTNQPNKWTESWVEFYKEHRIRHQCSLSGDRTLIEQGERLCDHLPLLFSDLDIKPAILHGDLWSGNVASVSGQPVIFDPACYYGHAEAEFGMAWCAGFGPNFYAAYENLIPRATGHAERKQLYQLYHYLNHFNLFGGGYYRTSVSLLSALNSEFA